MIDNDIAIVDPTTIRSSLENEFRVVEILNEESYNKDFDEFVDYVIERESIERESPFEGYFFSGVLVLDIAGERQERDMSVYECKRHLNIFIDWYKQKASEFFNIDGDIELLITHDIL